MKNTYKVTAICSNMCGGNIAKLNAIVEFDLDSDSMEEFFENVRSRFFAMGYNILNWHSINDIEGARCIFVVADNDRMCRRILKDCNEYAWAENHIKLIEDVENGKSIDGVREANGEVICAGGWTKDSLKSVMQNVKNDISVTCLVLDELGLDPNDNAGVRRICTNLGIDNIPGNWSY